MQEKFKKIKAFTLIELSIVVLIVSILISSVLSYSITKIDRAKKIATEEKMQYLYNALGVYLIKNGELPCPAGLEYVPTDNDYGLEKTCITDTTNGIYVSGSDSEIVYGMVPVQTLELPSSYGEDAWGSKIAYVVDKDFTAADGFGDFANDPTMIAKECLSSDCSTNRNITDNMVMFLISYGANKLGAYPARSKTQNTRSSLLEEYDNDVTSSPYFNVNFFVHSVNRNFDDILLFKTKNQIIRDFDLDYMVSCSAPGSSFINNSADSYSYDMNAYGTSNCTNRNVARITKHCGVFGKWFNVVSSCP